MVQSQVMLAQLYRTKASRFSGRLAPDLHHFASASTDLPILEMNLAYEPVRGVELELSILGDGSPGALMRTRIERGERTLSG